MMMELLNHERIILGLGDLIVCSKVIHAQLRHRIIPQVKSTSSEKSAAQDAQAAQFAIILPF